MDRLGIKRRVKKPRVPLTEDDSKQLAEIHGTDSVPLIVKRTGQPYRLVYNVINGRVKSISNRHYRSLFGKPSPHRQLKKVDGDQFRRMARLWLFLNEDQTQSDLYREYYGVEHPRKPNLRLFIGETHTVDIGLEQFMIDKFTDAGIDGPLLNQWLGDMEAMPRRKRVPYDRIQPILQYIDEHLGIHPTSILNQTVHRYESGELKSVSADIYERALSLQRKAEKAFAENDFKEMEKIKESITGKKPGYTLYLDIREELRFLSKYANKGVKHYLGRSSWTYETGKAKRVADWRARMILHDCDRFIRRHPNLSLPVLPIRWQRQQLRMFIGALIEHLSQLLSRQEGMDFEKRVLAPTHARNMYTDRDYGMTRFDMAPGVLGMRRKAFDLMVARHCNLFRTVGTYTKQWYLSNLYLEELSNKEYFEIISAKYELLARKSDHMGGIGACLH